MIVIFTFMNANEIFKTKNDILKQIIRVQNNFMLTIINKLYAQNQRKSQTNRREIYQNKNNKNKNFNKKQNFFWRNQIWKHKKNDKSNKRRKNEKRTCYHCNETKRNTSLNIVYKKIVRINVARKQKIVNLKTNHIKKFKINDSNSKFF